MQSEKVHPISVCIPVYNGEDFVRECVGSVLAQDYPDFEVIVAENLSTDRTREILTQFEDPRLTVIEADEHVHLAANLDRSALMSTKPWTIVLSADDVLRPGALQALNRALNKYADVDLVIGQATYIVEGADRVLGRADYSHKAGPVDDLEKFIVGNPFPVNINAVLLKTELARFRTDCGVVCDLNLMIELGQKQKAAVLIEDRLIAYREHSGATSANRVLMWSESLAVYLDHIGQSPQPELYRHRIFRMLFWCGAFLTSENRKTEAEALVDQAAGVLGSWRTKVLKTSLVFPVALPILERLRGLRRRLIGNS